MPDRRTAQALLEDRANSAGQISLSRILQAETPERRVPVGGIG